MHEVRNHIDVELIDRAEREIAKPPTFSIYAGVIGRELPVGFGVMGIAISLPSGDLVDDDLLVGNAAVETLRRENSEFGSLTAQRDSR